MKNNTTQKSKNNTTQKSLKSLKLKKTQLVTIVGGGRAEIINVG